MTKAPINLQDLRRRLYVKAKAEPSWRFWGLYVHVTKRETLWEAYRLAKANDGAPGIDVVAFEAIEAEGLRGFLERSYRPQRLRKVEIPKEGGKTRQLSIPSGSVASQVAAESVGEAGGSARRGNFAVAQ
jgi:RNA-directed DNA polymerase